MLRPLPMLFIVVSACGGNDVLNRFCPTECYGNWDSDSYQKVDPKTEGVGQCKAGKPVCDEDFNIIECQGEVLPSSEVCDGIDNDCNYRTDEGWDDEPLEAYGDSDTCGKFGECAKHNAVCIGGEYVCPYQPQPEQCDGLDNDCDARVDNDVFDGMSLQDRICYSGNPMESLLYAPCRAGLMECLYGEVICLSEVTPSIELCDEIDNDCNGVVDDTGDVLLSNYDIVFIVDTSGSMCDEIGAVAGALNEYAGQFDGNPNFRFALVIMSADNGPLVQVDTDFTDFASIRDRLLNLGCYGSGAEASLDSMEQVCDKTSNSLGLSWREDANGLFFAFTDEPQQTYSSPYTTAQDVIDSCIGSGTLPFIWSLYPTQFQYIAQGANGQHFTLVNDWETIVANMNSIIIALCGATED